MKYEFALLILFAVVSAAQTGELRTMRVDYVHSGSATEEQFALDNIVLEGAWPGPLDRWIDESNLGRYYFQVLDRANNRLIYSRGFASIYGEWETTDEAKQQRRAFHESLRFPAPSAPVQVVLKKRGPNNEFREVWSTVIDPSDAAIDRSAAPKLNVWAVMQNGAPRDKVDLLLLGDGYSAAEMDKWHRDARRTADTLFAVSPFKEHRADFNVWAIDTPAEESGVSRPSDGIYHRSPLRASYDAFGSERYVLTMDNRRLREIASAAPYEFIEIVVNDRKYGGGGIFNLYATVSAGNAFTPYVFVHEFGHHFAGLADEYYTSDVSYSANSERPEPGTQRHCRSRRGQVEGVADRRNSAAFALAEAGIRAAAAGDSEAPPRDPRRHRPEEEMEALFHEERERDTKLLGSGPNAGKVGAFEGAMYEGRGYYRPQQDCIMFTRDEVGFCVVCRRAIERVIRMYAR